MVEKFFSDDVIKLFFKYGFFLFQFNFIIFKGADDLGITPEATSEQYNFTANESTFDTQINSTKFTF